MGILDSTWFERIRHFRRGPYIAAAGLTLLFALPVGAYLEYLEHRHLFEQKSEAKLHAGIHARMLEDTLGRLSVAPRLLTAALPVRTDADFLVLAQEIMAHSGVISSVEIARSGQRPLTISRDDPIARQLETAAPHAALAQLSPLGDAIISTRGQHLLITQALTTQADNRAPQFWGYATALAPLSALARASHLENLAQEGYPVQLLYFRGNRSPLLTIFEGGEVKAGSEWVNTSIPLSGGGYLQLRLQPETGGAGGFVPLSWSFVLFASLLLFVLCVRLLRRPAELAAEVALRTQQLDNEKTALEKEIANRLAAERMLERSHKLLDTIFEHIPGMITLKRASDLRIARVNRSAERILGRARDTLVGRSSEEIYEAELADAMASSDYQAMLEPGLLELPVERLSMPDQPDRWLRVRKIALYDAEHKAEYILEFAEDVTEREALEQRFREHLNFLEQFVNAIPTPVFLKDAQGQYIDINAAFENFFGTSKAALAGQLVLGAQAADEAWHTRFDDELLADGGSRIYEAKVDDAQGMPREVLFHKAVVRATSGDAGGIVGIILDITERKSAEQRTHQLNRTLSILSATNQAIVRIHDSHQLLQEVSRIIREDGAFPVTWVYLDEPQEQTILADTEPGKAYAARLINILKSPNSPCTRSQRLFCRPSQCCNCDHQLVADLAVQGLESFVHLPLSVGGEFVGGIGIIGTSLDFKGDDERQLLEELADNVSFALEAIEQEERRKRAESKLYLAARVFENSAEGIVITDVDNKILMVNKAFSAVTGYSPEEVIGQNPRLLSSGRQSADFYQNMWRTLKARGEWRGEIENRRKDGEYYPEWLNISVVRSDAGDITNFVAIFSDLTTHKTIEKRLDFLAHYDALTSLPNRVLFTDRLEQALNAAKRAERPCAVMFLDIDRFKLINDTVGHATGDQLLLEVSRRLLASVSDSDSVSRLGGDEFAIILADIGTANDAGSSALAIQQALRQPIEIQEHEFHLSASIGISIFPDDADNIEDLASNADSAMYSAIENGGNTYRFFQQEMNQNSAERMRIEGKLHGALERGELMVYFQPLVSARTGKIAGAEALLRWYHPDLGGFVSPATFIPLLEETGLIVDVGEWVLRTACLENHRWREITGDDYFVAVNLSAIQLTDSLLLSKVGAILEELNFPPQHLEIELTESAIMRDAVGGIQLLNELKNMGIALSIDDFGTGYSSLSYLKQLPIDTLKIDRSFICDTPGDREAASITRAIVALGHSLQLEIIAEGVETAEQVCFLREAGVDILQGFYLSCAVSAADFSNLVAAGAYQLPSTATHSGPVVIAEEECLATVSPLQLVR